MTKYRSYTDPYGSQDNQSIFRLFQHVGGFQDSSYFTFNRTQRINYCAKTRYPHLSNNATGVSGCGSNPPSADGCDTCTGVYFAAQGICVHCMSDNATVITLENVYTLDPPATCFNGQALQYPYIDVIDIMIHMQVLDGIRYPRRYV